MKVGTLSEGHEEDIDGYVWQADTSGIKAAWDADDHQSGVVGYKVAVGTTKGRYYYCYASRETPVASNFEKEAHHKLVEVWLQSITILIYYVQIGC